MSKLKVTDAQQGIRYDKAVEVRVSAVRTLRSSGHFTITFTEAPGMKQFIPPLPDQSISERPGVT